jgi:predicted transcriptional regulator
VVVLACGRRGRVEIMMDILDEALRGVNKTGIVYGANLNFNMADRYLSFLMNKGLLVKLDGERGSVYKITEQGREVLKNFRRIRKFV